ncbi:T6SS amidase immunity protein Tai4 family protein [Snodgrassella alvi]|jgi:hypothetical protein|uniref:T6SS amidase immunity protein Tai4 family protein n=1 Tax=Snodgrassella alvi TaxID=1196083 RepID=UPI001C558E46|nr:T6SS amidase immunity protein Tai4 family protein [Snodgrassella alvi]
MRNFKLKFLYGYFLALLPFLCNAANNNITSPEAPRRTFIQNYKDMVLGNCLAKAYLNGEIASMDSGSSVSGLEEWDIL